MNVNSKKLLSLLVVIALVLAMTPVISFQAEAAAFDPATTECEACGGFPESGWTAWTPGSATRQWTLGAEGEHQHWYLNTANWTGSKAPTVKISGGPVCLHLNGNSFTASASYAIQVNADLNIMGSGTITGKAGCIVFATAGCEVNLYGGTYTATTDTYSISTGTPGGKIVVHEGATIEKYIYLRGGAGKTAELEVKGGTINAPITLHEQAVASVSIKGGTFNYNPDTSYIADGYEVTNNGNGTYSVVQGAAPPQPDHLRTTCHGCGATGVTWTRITRNSVEQITADGHYYLDCEWNKEGQAIVLPAYDICLDLNGHSITNTNADETKGRCLEIKDGQTVHIMGTEASTVSTGSPQGAIYISNGTVNLHGGTYSGKAGERVFHITGESATVNVLGGTYTGTYNVVKEGKLNITGGTFSSNPVAYATAVLANSATSYTAYENAQDAVDAYTGTGYVALGKDATIELKRDTHVDNGGNNVTVRGNYKLYAMNSSDDAYNGTGSWTVENPENIVRDVINPITNARYVTVTKEGTTASYRLSLVMHKVVLRADTNDTGLYYKAKITCSEELKDLMVWYGAVFDMSTEPDFNNFKDSIASSWTVLDAQNLVLDENNSAETNTAFVYGIFEDGDAENARYGEMEIPAMAYIELDLDDNGTNECVLSENTARKSLLSTMQMFDQEDNMYLETVQKFYQYWAANSLGDAWADYFTYIDVVNAE